MARGVAETRDFPFYDGRPIRISAAGWALVLAGCAVGFLALTLSPLIGRSDAVRLSAIAVFVAAPLVALALASGGRWTAIFHRPTLRDVRIGLAFAPLNLLVTAAIALLVMRRGVTSANPVAALLPQMTDGDLAVFFAGTVPQLLGEELVTILPFLAVLSGMIALRAPRPVAIGVAWLSTSLLFGALHLPTYQWRLGQVLLVIGAARVVLTGAYLLTRNIWSSFIAHLAHDWTLFAAILAIHAAQA